MPRKSSCKAVALAAVLLASCTRGYAGHVGVEVAEAFVKLPILLAKVFRLVPWSRAQKRWREEVSSVDRRTFRTEGCVVDNTGATFCIHVSEPGWEKVTRSVFPTMRAAVSSCGVVALPSFDLIDCAMKQFNNGFYAALELAVQDGIAGKTVGKGEILSRLHARLEEEGRASTGFEREGYDLACAYVIAGMKAGGAEVPGELPPAAARMLAGFLGRPELSKPVGFYTWSARLEAIFRRDRFFQTVLRADKDADLAASVLIARAVEREAVLASFDFLSRLYSRLTNPLNSLTVNDLVPLTPLRADSAEAVNEFRRRLKANPRHTELERRYRERRGEGAEERLGLALFPYSRSRETYLFGLGGVTEDLMAFLIDRVENGELSFKPDGESGWYEYQQHALEALLTLEKNAEGGKLNIDRDYRERLREAFRTGFARARETHVKQLELPEEAAAEEEPERVVYIAPRILVEPLPTVYLRMARAHRFLGRELTGLVGQEALRGLHILREGEKPSREDALSELESVERLEYGLALVAADEIGLDLETRELSALDRVTCRRAALRWLARYWTDARLSKDVRFAVPVQINVLEDGAPFETVNWACVGVGLLSIIIEYDSPPTVAPERGGRVRPEFYPAHFLIPVTRFVEFHRPVELGVLTRSEFRNVLDSCSTLAEALDVLEGRKAAGAAHAR